MLKEQRRKAGLSQAQLSEKSGINLRTIQNYERKGRNINYARLEVLASLAIALDCRITEVIDDEELIDLARKATL